MPVLPMGKEYLHRDAAVVRDAAPVGEHARNTDGRLLSHLLEKLHLNFGQNKFDFFPLKKERKKKQTDLA